MDFDLDDFVRKAQEEIMADARRTYSEEVVRHWMRPVNFRRMDKCDGYGRVTGKCGDTMEVFIRVEGGRIMDCSFFTDGCGATIACGSVVVSLAMGQSVGAAASLNKKSVLDACNGLPEENEHCAELAANALQYAIIDYETSCSAEEKGKT